MEFARDPIVTAATPTAAPAPRRVSASSFQSRVRGIGWAALDQLVADAAHRGDVAGAAGIVAEFGAEFPDVYVDGPVHNGRLGVRIDGGEQLVAGEGGRRRLQKGPP